MSTRKNLESNALLENYAAGYSPQTYYADEIAPVVARDESAGRYRKARLHDNISAPNDDHIAEYGSANELGYKYEDAPFACIDRGLKKPTSFDKIAKHPEASRERTVRRIMNELLLKREQRVFAKAQDPANFASGNVIGVTTSWATTGDALADVDSAVSALTLRHSSEEVTMTMLVALEGFQALRKNASLRGPGSEDPILAQERIAQLLGVDRIVVTRAVANTASPDAADTVTPARIWTPSNALLFLSPVGDVEDEEGQFMTTFRYDGISESGTGMLVQHWDDYNRGAAGSEITKVAFSDDEVCVQNDAAVLLQNII